MAEPRRPSKKKAAPRAADGLRRPRAADELRRPLSADELRRQAEERLDGLSAASSAAPSSAPVPEELAAAVHELRVHQIELEMQNEELRGAQLALETQREKYFELFDLAPVGYLTLSDKGIVGDANLTAAHLLGVERRLLVGRPFSAFVLAADQDAYYLHLRELGKTGAPQSCELRLQRIDADPFWARLEGRPPGDADGEPLQHHLTFSDVHARVLAEEALREAEWKFRALFENGPIGVAYHRMLYDDSGVPIDYYFIDANDRYLELTGVDPRGKTVTQAFPGIEQDPFDWIGTFGRVARTGEPIRFEQYLQPNDRWYDCVGYQYEPDHFVAAFVEITARKQAEEALARGAAQLREQLHDTVKAMGAIIGLRDPYTAAHERRVAALAAAIAVEMGLGEEAREGLAFAGEVHDIGKIGIPAEILSKPSALSEIEFSLIKQHPQTGRELLGDIRFRQPVAGIVAQHHERQDGSGYPAGLQGDEIMLEARILAVADVVEAMASHRPYRAALGLEAALAEVSAGAGTRYDDEAVAACKRVFGRGFAFSEA